MTIEPANIGPPSSQGEIFSLTSIRGIAAAWVVLFHFSPVLYMLAPEADVAGPLIQAGSFAVPLFFILSGYVLGLRYLARFRGPTPNSLIKFWWLRLGRIYPIHAFTFLVTLCLVTRHGWPTDEGHSVGSFFANVFMIQAWDRSLRMTWNYPAWSISSEWFAYLFFPLIAFPLARASRPMTFGLLALAAAASAGVYAWEDLVIFKGLAVVVPTFVGGVALAVLLPPMPNASPRWPWEEVLLLAIAILPFLIAPGPVQSVLLLIFFFGIVAALGRAGNHGCWLCRSSSLVFLGEISYSLYMTHVITITLLTRFGRLDEFTEQTLFVRLGLVLGGLGIILAAAAAVYYGVELPLRNLSRRLIAPANAAAGSAPKQTALVHDESR